MCLIIILFHRERIYFIQAYIDRIIKVVNSKKKVMVMYKRTLWSWKGRESSPDLILYFEIVLCQFLWSISSLFLFRIPTIVCTDLYFRVYSFLFVPNCLFVCLLHKTVKSVITINQVALVFSYPGYRTPENMVSITWYLLS